MALTLRQRQRAVGECRYLLARKGEVHYKEIRPINYEYHAALDFKHTWTTDCSGSVTSIFKKIGAPDPNKRGYNGTGNTDTLATGMTPVPNISSARRGDVIIFHTASGATTHVVMLMEWGKLHADPMVFSHGSEEAPFELRFSYEYYIQRRFMGVVGYKIYRGGK